MQRWERAASAVVLDPRNGDILAMAVERGYDANRFLIVPRDLQRNRAVTDTYEPGSTFKVVTVSALEGSSRLPPRSRSPTRSTSRTGRSATRTSAARSG